MKRYTSVLAFTLAVVCAFIAVNAVALDCPDGAKTDVVYVKFNGCSKAEPGLRFDVTVDDELITVAKKATSDPYWIGRTSKLFVITDPKLTILADAMPTARVMCGTWATGLREEGCAALFTVACEPLWLLRVEEKNARAKISSKRQKARIAACPNNPQPELDGPGEVELTLSEKLEVTIGTAAERRKPAELLVKASLDFGLLPENKPLKLSNKLVVLTAVEGGGQPGTIALDALAQKVRARFPDMTFTNLPRKTTEE